MGSIDKFRPASTDPRQRPRWRARWRDPDGTQRSQVFAKKVDAVRHLTHVEHSSAAGTYVDPSAGRVTFKDYAEEWRSRQLHRPGTAITVEHRLRLHVYPTLGGRPMAAIKPSEVQAWVTDRSAAGLAAGTVTQLYRTVAAVFNDAVRDRVLSVSPCDRITLPRVSTAGVTIPTVEQVHAITAKLYPRYRLAAVLAAGAGLRLGEVFGLGPEHVDTEAETLRVERQLVTLSGSGAELAPPKTPGSVRTVPVSRVVLERIAAHSDAFPPADGLLIVNELDAPVRSNVFQRAWQRACKAAAVEGVTFHDLRHFFASALIAEGCSVVAVQKALGHAKATETLNTYSHLWPTDEDKTRAAIGRILGP